MKTANMVVHTYGGALDLYYGVPNLEGAKVVNVEPQEESGVTYIQFELANGDEWSMLVFPAH